MGPLGKCRFRLADGARCTGFTLIELLLVLVIMGLMYSLASMSFAGMERMALDSEANRLQRTLRALQHEALLRRSPTGLQLDESGYQAVALDSLSGEWSELDGRHFRRRELTAEGISLRLRPMASERPGRSAMRDGELPQVILVGAGIGNPYVLRLASRQQPELEVNLVGDGGGNVVRQ